MKVRLVALLVAGSLLLGATGGTSVFAQGLPTVSVSSSGRFNQVTYVTPVEAEILIGALLFMPGLDPGPAIDLYVGLIDPDGRFVSLVGDPEAPRLVASATPVPLLAEVTPRFARRFSVRHTFAPAEPQGWYTVYGVIVRPREPFSDPKKWINASFFPLLVQPRDVVTEQQR